MKNSRGQLALILMLMLALFLQIEGVIPNIFAGSQEPIVITNEKEGLEFNVVFNNESFTARDILIIKADVINKSHSPIHYYSGTRQYGVRGALGATLCSVDGASRFTDKFVFETSKISSDASVLNGELMPGETINCEFEMLPYFLEEGTKNLAESGEYVLKLWYSKDAQEIVETEFPVTLVKRFGKMYIKI